MCAAVISNNELYKMYILIKYIKYIIYLATIKYNHNTYVKLYHSCI